MAEGIEDIVVDRKEAKEIMELLKDLMRNSIEGVSNKRIDETHLPLMDLPEISREVVERREKAERIGREKPLSVDAHLIRESVRRAEDAYDKKFHEDVQKEVERQLRNKSK